jgi:hypothetical protein
VKYVVRKRVDHLGRMSDQQQFRKELAFADPAFTYSGADVVRKEPFALMHRSTNAKEAQRREEQRRRDERGA